MELKWKTCLKLALTAVALFYTFVLLKTLPQAKEADK